MHYVRLFSVYVVEKEP